MRHNVWRGCLFLSVMAVSVPLAAQQPAFQPITDHRLAAILETVGLEPQVEEKGKLRLDVDDLVVVIRNTGKDALLYAGFDTDGQGDLHRVEIWNQEARDESRAYLDKDGDPCVEADVDYEQGLDEATIAAEVKAFAEIAQRFRDRVVHGEDVRVAVTGPPRKLPTGLISGVLEDLEIDYELSRPDPSQAGGPTRLYVLVMDGERISLAVHDDGLLMLADRHLEDVATSDVNEWNRDNRFGRVAIDSSGKPVLVSMLNLPGNALTPRAVRQWIRVFSDTRKPFHALITEHGTPAAASEGRDRGLPDGWAVFDFPKGRFRAAFPGPPEEVVETLPGHEGDVEMVLARFNDGATSYVAGSQVYPDVVAEYTDERFYREFSENFLPETGRITSERTVTQSGHTGREFRFVDRDDAAGTASEGVLRLYRDRSTGFLLITMTRDAAPPRDRIDAFLGGFEILAPSQAGAQARTVPDDASGRPGAPREAESDPPGQVVLQDLVIENDRPFLEEPDASEWKALVPDGWTASTIPELNVHLAMPVRPSRERRTLASEFGPVERFQVFCDEDGIRYAVDCWRGSTFPGLETDVLCRWAFRGTLPPGTYRPTMKAGILNYAGRPGRSLTVEASDRQSEVWMYAFREGERVYVFSLEMPKDRIDSGLASQFFGNIKLLGERIGSSGPTAP